MITVTNRPSARQTHWCIIRSWTVGNGFVTEDSSVLSNAAKLVDGVMPRIYSLVGQRSDFASLLSPGTMCIHWYWSNAALCSIGCIGYVNAEVNAPNQREKFNNAHIMVFSSGG